MYATHCMLSGRDLTVIDPYFARDCSSLPIYSELDRLSQSNGFVPATEVFSGLFFVGQVAWSSWAYDTGDGLVIFDTLASAEEAERIIIPGIEKFGYSGDDIKYVLLSHEHFDHYGGARYLQEKYNAPVLASANAWEAMLEDSLGPLKNDKAVTVSDGDRLTVGNLTLTFYETPGHTDGTISWIFPVTDLQSGENHVAALYGRMGFSKTAETLTQQVASFERFSGLAGQHDVEVLIGNHQARDRSLYHLDLLAHRECGDEGCNLANPYVIGVDAYKRWCKVQSLCIRTYAARMNIYLSQ